ncbi:hypothetical protein GN958_ATG18051 [Phytophthora infestans]|uniref:HAT C-terminal dimerisation domain-containing protein n=1 Tax=Phytophthora infestans TaxID=4787 RepID=A0A8S9TXJ2_PHYIN|nr:hypothetical protein GN958_ATG18051 [Phytophthora infestans]
MHEDDDILDKVNALMGKLNMIKIRHHLREADVLMSVYRSATRWSSTFPMIDRYFRIYSKLDRIDDQLVDFIPTPRENVRLKALYEDLKNLESVKKKLHLTPVSLLDVRALFDHVVKHYPGTELYLSPTASLVKFPDFENEVVKLMAGRENILTGGEQAAVVILLQTSDTVATGPQEEGEDAHQSFAEASLSQEEVTPSREDLTWIPPTSNDVERLFSRAGTVLSRLRRSLNPMTLETVLFLQFNRSLWDASAVAEAIELGKKRPRAREEENVN